MTTLVIDCVTSGCLVGLIGPWGEDGGTDGNAVERYNGDQRGPDEHIIGFIDALLTDHDLKPKDLEQIAVVVGPGSFTGVRIGVATALGLSQALPQARLIGIPTGLVYHQRAQKNYGGAMGDGCLVALDVRRPELIVEQRDCLGQPVGAPQTITLERIAELERDLPVIGNGVEKNLVLADSLLGDRLLTKDVARLTVEDFQFTLQNAPVDCMQRGRLEPVYVRPPDVGPQQRQ